MLKTRGPETMMPTQAKAARPAQWIHLGKGVSSWLPPLPFPETTTQLCESPSTLCRRTGPRAVTRSWLLHYEACVHTCIHMYVCKQPREHVCCARRLGPSLGDSRLI